MKPRFASKCVCAAVAAVCAIWMVFFQVNGLSAQGAKTPPPTEAQKQAAQAQAHAQKIAMENLRRQEAEGLRNAYVLLSLANTNYAGHKGKAMKEVETALTLLDANAMKPLQQRIRGIQQVNNVINANLFAVGLAPDADEAQAISDAQVANAGGMLVVLGTAMANAKQPKLLEHVQNAIREIQASPKHEAAEVKVKGRESHILTAAYILLASANHDYNGHRVNAMAKVSQATTSLDAQILTQGNVKQRIKAIQDSNTQLLARINAGQEPTISEPQVISDAQMLLADTLIQRAAHYLNTPQQKTVLGQIRAAHNEIGLALSVK